MQDPSGHFEFKHIDADETDDDIDAPDVILRCKHCYSVVDIDDANDHLRTHDLYP